MTHFLSAESAGKLLGITGWAFRKRAERYGIQPQIWPHNRRKFTFEQVRAVEAMGKPPAGNRRGVADHRRIA